MARDSLESFVAAVRADWGPISTGLVARCRAHLDRLSAADAGEAWLAGLHEERPATRELHREPDHGFMLLAHSEQAGLYRPPHDHGRAWVVYAVQSGALEIGGYVKIADPDGRQKLVRRDTIVLRPGEARAYLPGDIHDTRCLTENAMVLRFTERDLRHEDQSLGLVTRFAAHGDEWFAPLP